jgi:hypothetical protein
MLNTDFRKQNDQAEAQVAKVKSEGMRERELESGAGSCEPQAKPPEDEDKKLSQLLKI